MIAQIEQYIEQGCYDDALVLVPMLEQVFSDNPEILWVIKALQCDLESQNQESLQTLQRLKQVLVE